KVYRLKRRRDLGTVLEPVKRRISTLAFNGTAVEILGQRRRAEEQEPKEDDEKKARPLLQHGVSPVREVIKIIPSFSSLLRPRCAGACIRSTQLLSHSMAREPRAQRTK